MCPERRIQDRSDQRVLRLGQLLDRNSSGCLSAADRIVGVEPVSSLHPGSKQYRVSLLATQNYGQNYYIFNPKSDVAQWVTTGIYTTCSNSCTRTANGTIVGECNPCDAINQTAVMNETMMLKPSLFANSNGVYTIVGGDEWGQIVLLHFVVSQQGEPTTISTSTASSMSRIRQQTLR